MELHICGCRLSLSTTGLVLGSNTVKREIAMAFTVPQQRRTLFWGSLLPPMTPSVAVIFLLSNPKLSSSPTPHSFSLTVAFTCWINQPWTVQSRGMGSIHMVASGPPEPALTRLTMPVTIPCGFTVLTRHLSLLSVTVKTFLGCLTERLPCLL